MFSAYLFLYLWNGNKIIATIVSHDKILPELKFRYERKDSIKILSVLIKHQNINGQ